MNPIFIFGTGRCGSTHLQRLITLSTRCWIWGEHEGFLEPLLESVRRYEGGQRLRRFVFGRAARDEEQLIADMTSGADMLSWVNELDRDEFRAEVISLLDRMFRSRLPKDWTDWGFKEIRYGHDNNAPDNLLKLFPGSTAIFTFRDPRSTLESMMRTWSPLLMGQSQAIEKVDIRFRTYAKRWQTIMEYFLNYKKLHGDRVVFASLDKLRMPAEDILLILRLEPVRAIPSTLGITNRGPSKLPDWASGKFDELLAEHETLFLDLFERARAWSDADFAPARRQQAPPRGSSDQRMALCGGGTELEAAAD